MHSLFIVCIFKIQAILFNRCFLELRVIILTGIYRVIDKDIKSYGEADACNKAYYTGNRVIERRF